MKSTTGNGTGRIVRFGEGRTVRRSLTILLIALTIMVVSALPASAVPYWFRCRGHSSYKVAWARNCQVYPNPPLACSTAPRACK
jgi:Fe-S-cluster containining protein